MGADEALRRARRGRSGTPRRARRRRRRPPGPASVEQEREVLRADHRPPRPGRPGRHRRPRRPDRDPSVRSAACALARPRDGRRADGRIDRRRASPPRTTPPRRRSPVVSTYGPCGTRGRRRHPGRSTSTTARPPRSPGGRGSRPHRSTGDQLTVTCPRPRLGTHLRGRRQRDVRRGTVALRLRAERLEPGDPRAGRGAAASPSRRGGRRHGARRAGVEASPCRSTGLSALPDLLGRERIAQHVVRRARCRSPP